MRQITKLLLLTIFLFAFYNLAMAQTVRTTKSGYLASVSEKLLDKAIEYSVAKDHVALQKLINTKLVFPLKAGLNVYIVDTKIFSGKVKIRPVGQTVEVWTVSEAIQD